MKHSILVVAMVALAVSACAKNEERAPAPSSAAAEQKGMRGVQGPAGMQGPADMQTQGGVQSQADMQGRGGMQGQGGR